MEIENREHTTFVVDEMLFLQSKPFDTLLVSVVVPVKDEAKHLLNTLDALRLQQDESGNNLDARSYEVLLLANNCSDDSFEIARNYQERYPEFTLQVAELKLPKEIANIGTVRCLLMDAACKRLLSIGKYHGIIASTDGDSEVDRKWIINIINEINKGNDAVGGRIIAKPQHGSSSRYYLQNERYRSLIAKAESIADPLDHDPWPRHFQYFGANLAVTCQMYLQVGGLPKLPWLEDEAFYNALVAKDARIRKSPFVKVRTSNRQEGRVEIGFSQQLREWADMAKSNQRQLVAPAEELITKFNCRKELRYCWSGYHKDSNFKKEMIDGIADKLSLQREWLGLELTQHKYFGKFWELVEATSYAGEWGKKWKPVTINTAIKDLRLYSTEFKKNTQQSTINVG